MTEIPENNLIGNKKHENLIGKINQSGLKFVQKNIEVKKTESKDPDDEGENDSDEDNDENNDKKKRKLTSFENQKRRMAIEIISDIMTAVRALSYVRDNDDKIKKLKSSEFSPDNDVENQFGNRNLNQNKIGLNSSDKNGIVNYIGNNNNNNNSNTRNGNGKDFFEVSLSTREQSSYENMENKSSENNENENKNLMITAIESSRWKSQSSKNVPENNDVTEIKQENSEPGFFSTLFSSIFNFFEILPKSRLVGWRKHNEGEFSFFDAFFEAFLSGRGPYGFLGWQGTINVF